MVRRMKLLVYWLPSISLCIEKKIVKFEVILNLKILKVYLMIQHIWKKSCHLRLLRKTCMISALR